MSVPRRRRSGVMAFALSVAFLATGLISAPVTHAAGNGPSVRLVPSIDKVTLKRPQGQRAYLDLGVYVAAVGGAFEIQASRPDYDTAVSVWQVVRSGGTVTQFPLPSSVENDWRGLSRFLHLVVTDADGNVVLDRFHAFCPGAGDLARVSDDGPDIPTYPQFCGGNPFTLGAVWGIDAGWASSAFGYGTNDAIKGPDGHYTATVSISPDYQALFDIPAQDSSVTVDVRVKTTKGNTCLPFCGGSVPRPGGGLRGPNTPAVGPPTASVPIMTDPDPSIRPDLIALPAWGITIDHQRKRNRDFLDFGATVWDKGPSPMVVEGFRRPGEPIMDGWEYFYDERRTRRPGAGRRPDVRRPPGSSALALRAVRPVLPARRRSDPDRPQREDRVLPGADGRDRHDRARGGVEPVLDRTRDRLRQPGFDLDPRGASDRMGRHVLPGASRTVVRHHGPAQRHVLHRRRGEPRRSPDRGQHVQQRRAAQDQAPRASRDTGRSSCRCGTGSTRRPATGAGEASRRSRSRSSVRRASPRPRCATCAAR